MVPALNVNLGGKKPSLLGFDALVSTQPSLMVDGTVLSTAEIQKLLQQTEGLALLKGKWVEVDHAKLRKLLAQMEEIPEQLTAVNLRCLKKSVRRSMKSGNVFWYLRSLRK